jgi:hypothetical protein
VTKVFNMSAGVLLLLTAEAKLFSSVGSASILQTIDPVLGIPFRELMWAAGGVELLIAFACFAGRDRASRAALVAWLATNFVVYRLCLVWIGYHKPCGCLGTLTDALNLSPQAADTIMKVVLGYLCIGSYVTLLWAWRRGVAGPALVSARTE